MYKINYREVTNMKATIALTSKTSYNVFQHGLKINKISLKAIK